ncbi:MAG: extracellular solute-binding protein [Actinomycetia bacterium]|nr:extracellular solute-binding protein [Actinomycetes bacterium]
MRRTLKMFVLLLAFALVAAACSSSDDSSDTTVASGGTETTVASGGTETTVASGGTETTVASGGDAVEVTFWHAMADDLGAVVDGLVDEYNSSQSAVHVTSTFQGSYDDTFNAFTAALQAGTAPNIVQNFDLASQTMIDTGALLPAYQVMPEGQADTFIPAARDYYSDENGMVALAFNSSTPIVYYNAEKFADAGLEAPADDWNFSDFAATCDALEAAGTEFCVTFGQVGWYFEQILANSGGLYFDNDNGRTGRATEAMFNDATGVEVFTFLTGLIADGHAPNLGNTWSDTDSVFFAGDAAMIFDSTSGTRGFQDNAGFEVETAYIPHSDSSERNGVVIGGAALWLVDSDDPVTNAASWDFMNFMVQEDPQVVWHVGTGYFPVLSSLMTDTPPELAEFWVENPNFVTAIEQLATTKTEINGEPNYAVLGGRSGPSPEIRRLVVEAYSAVLDGGATPQEALDAVAEQVKTILADYNAFFE